MRTRSSCGGANGGNGDETVCDPWNDEYPWGDTSKKQPSSATSGENNVGSRTEPVTSVRLSRHVSFASIRFSNHGATTGPSISATDNTIGVTSSAIGAQHATGRLATTVADSTIPARDWTAHGEAQTTPRAIPSRFAGLSTSRRQSSYNQGPRTKDHGVLFRDQVAGVIVRHWDVREVTDFKCTTKEKDVYLAKDGCLYVKKLRDWIIVGRDEERETVDEVPIFTYNDTGLAKKPQQDWCEYLSVKPKAVPLEDFVNQSPGNSILRIANVLGEKDLTRSTMVTRYTDVLRRSLDCDELKKIGELDSESRDVIIELVDSRDDAPKEQPSAVVFVKKAALSFEGSS